MAKKLSFPNRPCPKCGKPIHIKTKKHEDCGWALDGQASAAPAVVKKGGRPKKRATNGRRTGAGGITVEDISAVKSLVDRMGTEKVQQLAQVLAK